MFSLSSASRYVCPNAPPTTAASLLSQSVSCKDQLYLKYRICQNNFNYTDAYTKGIANASQDLS